MSFYKNKTNPFIKRPIFRGYYIVFSSKNGLIQHEKNFLLSALALKQQLQTKANRDTTNQYVTSQLNGVKSQTHKILAMMAALYSNNTNGGSMYRKYKHPFN